MAVQRLEQSTSCGNHRPYRTKADALAKIGWHLTCWKCRQGRVMDAFLCEPRRKHWHIGHRPARG